MENSRLIIPYVLDRLDCQNLQGMFTEAMRKRHQYLSEVFHFADSNEFSNPFSENHSQHSISFIQDQKSQTRILETKELADYITSEYWSMIDPQISSSSGIQNMFEWTGPFRAYFLMLYPNQSLANLLGKIEGTHKDLSALASDLSTKMLQSFLDSFLTQRRKQIRIHDYELPLWNTQLLPTTSQTFEIHRPDDSPDNNMGVWARMRERTNKIDLGQKIKQSHHIWMPWIAEDQHYSKFERFLIYNARINFAEAKQHALFLMFIPESNFNWLQKALRRHLECMDVFA